MGFVARTMKDKKEQKNLTGLETDWWGKVFVQGEDDFSLELECHGTKAECVAFWEQWNNRLSGMSIVNKCDLKDWGFLEG